MKEVLKFLGNGSCFNTKIGNTSAFIRDKNYLLLIDCGEDVFSKIREYNLCSSLLHIDILITHMHSDHIGSLSSLIYYLKYCCDITPNIYFHDEKLIQFLDLLGHSSSDYVFRKIEYNQTYQLVNCEKKMIIETKKINHLSHINSIGYIITYENNKIIYTGDSKELFPNVFELIDKYKDNFNVFCYQDTSFFETPAHMSLKELKKLIPNEYKKYFYCIHLEVLKDIDCEKIIKDYGFNVPNLYHLNHYHLKTKNRFLLTEKFALTLPCTLDAEDMIELLSTVNVLEYNPTTKKFKFYVENEEQSNVQAFDYYDFLQVVDMIDNHYWYLID